MPMNTTFDTRFAYASSNASTWLTISAALKFCLKPSFPVAQNEHFIAHPLCDDTHAVNLFFSHPLTNVKLPSRPPALESGTKHDESGMPTASYVFVLSQSPVTNTIFPVPSLASVLALSSGFTRPVT